jgi:hypothetical protein
MCQAMNRPGCSNRSMRELLSRNAGWLLVPIEERQIFKMLCTATGADNIRLKIDPLHAFAGKH